MSLNKYWQKRTFSDTPEPKGKVNRSKGKELIFVVQEHHASSLHFDFRLELDGVLKSWAVPKGPSMDPKNKRLAVHVEDHPYSYKDFEGVIPEGNYGAGEVFIWDNGTYFSTVDPENSEKQLRKELKNGQLKITLNGKKLKGEFALIKFKGQEKNWLLIKDSPTPRLRRVGTGGREQGAKLAETSLPPMLATLIDEPFDSKDWIFEIKWDGYRAISYIEDEVVNMFSRNQILINHKYPQIVEALHKIKEDVILDGEIVVLDNEGKPNFQMLQNYRINREGNLFYMVFDILKYKNKDLKDLSLLERKKLLKSILPKSNNIKYSDHIAETGINFFKAAHDKNLEGIVAKRKSSVYVPGIRSNDWLKIKTVLRQEFIIGGYTMPQGIRKELGALLLGVNDSQGLKYVGLTGTGFDEESLRFLKNKLEKIQNSTSPFYNLNHHENLQNWVEPKLICEVKFSEWTKDGMLRQAVFQGLREDKSVSEIKVEIKNQISKIKNVRQVKSHTLKGTSRSKVKSKEEKTLNSKLQVTNMKKKSKSATSKLQPATSFVTHPDRIYFPKDGYTKQDLVDYYLAISDILLPYIKDRPQNLHRFPAGIDSQGFYHKDIEQETPKFVEKINLPTDKDEEITYVLIQNKETLAYLANLGCIEINPWNSRIKSLDSPDYLVFDLDPETSFSHVVDVALELRKILEELELFSICKTSGKDGLHVYLPLEVKYQFEEVRQFAELIGQVLQKRMPKLITLESAKKGRKGKVFIDYAQNRKGQTTVSPYSVRPRDGAPVSTPLEWREVNHKLNPKNYTIKNTLKRLEKKGDLWEEMNNKVNLIEKSVEGLEQMLGK